MGQRVASLHGADRRQALVHSNDAYRGDQSRPGGDVLPDRSAACRAPEHRSVALLRPWNRKRRPAGVRRDDLAGLGACRPGTLHEAVGERFPPKPLPRRQVPLAGRSGALPVEPGGREPRSAADVPRRPFGPEPNPTGAVRRPGDRDTNRPVRDGISDADICSGTNGSVE